MRNENGDGNTQQTKGMKYFLSALGPGMILAATSIGPGSIVSATNSGASFGYTLCWWFMVMLVFRAIFTYGMNKYTVITGKPLMVGVREAYGPLWAGLAGVFAFLGQCVYGIGNCIGVGLAFVILFPGISLKGGVIIGLVICVLLLFLKGLYKKIENIMKILVLIMVVIFIASFIGTLSLASESAAIVSHSFVGLPDGAMAIMLSLLGTTASLGTCAYGSSLAKEKGYTIEDLKRGGLFIDVIVGVIAIGIISLACYFVGANLFPGAPISTGMDLALGLSSVLGAFIKPVFGIGFLAAALSSMMMAPKLGINLLLQSFNKKSGMESKVENVVSILMLIFAVVIVFLYGGVPAQLLTLAQIGGVINTPILGIMTLLLLNRESDMGEYKIGKGFSVAILVSYVVVMITVFNNVITIVSKL